MNEFRSSQICFAARRENMLDNYKRVIEHWFKLVVDV